MPGRSAAAKMDWPKLGLIKSQGWRCCPADIINTKMIMVEQFGSAEADQFTPPVWGPIEIKQSCDHLRNIWNIKKFIKDQLLLCFTTILRFASAAAKAIL